MSFPETQIKGSILVGSSVAGAASMTPLPPGPDGQVLTTDSTTPTGLKWAPGGAGSDIFAATRVVSLTPGDGTDLTIAAAIAALPAEGGLIFVKQGTYPLAATLALTDKPIEIVGAGDGTILDLGALGIAAFTAAFARKYVIRDLQVTGSVANVDRRVVSISAAATVSLSRITGSNIRTVFEVTGGAAAILESDNCTILLLNDPASWFVLANASTSIHAENMSVTGASSAGGISGGPVAEIFGSTLSAVNGIDTGDGSVFSGSDFQGSAGETVSLGNLTKVTGCRFVSLFIDVSGNENKFTGCLFHGSLAQTRCMDVTSPATGPAIVGCSFFGCTTDQLRIAAIDTIVQGCVFFDNGALVRGIDVLVLGFRTVIEGNNFQFMTEAIQMGSSNCIVTGNVGCRVVETGAANVNVYGDNTGFDPATIIGPSSRIENYQTLNVGVDFLLTEFQRTLEVDASGAPRTITLPTALSARWRKYTIKKIDASANTVTIDAAGAETIDGALTVVLTTQYQSVTIQSNGTGWDIIAQVSSASSGADIFAATRVVSLIPGDGTDLTVAAAIAALPAEGGRIYVKEGTYPLAVTNTLPDKPVDIIGSGDGTIFSLGANAIAAFTIPDGLTAQRNYSFQHFKVVGTSVANQRILSVEDSNAFGVVTNRSLRSEGIQIPISITAGDGNFLTPVFVTTYDSWFVPIANGTGILCDSNGISEIMNVSFYNTKFIVDELNTIGGTINGDSFGNLDVAFYDCDLSLTGEDGLSTIHAERCRIFNFSGTPQITFINGNFALGDDYLPTTAFINCTVLGMWIIDGGGMNVTGGWWTNTRIETAPINGRSSLLGVTFRGDGTSLATFPVSGGVTAFIGIVDTDINIFGCTFSVFSMTITNYIRGASSMVIQGCAFRGLTGASDAGIRLTGVNNFLVGCDFDTDNWGCPPVREVAPADRNVYNDNLGINGNPNPLIGGAGVDSIFVGVRNTFNGLSQFRATAATTDAFVTVTNQIAASGVQGIATIKNTGLNGMNVRETGVDQFGVTSTVTTLVAAGNDLRLDPTNNVGTARPPYTRYSIEVQSAVAGNSTTYVLRLGMNGEVTW